MQFYFKAQSQHGHSINDGRRFLLGACVTSIQNQRHADLEIHGLGRTSAPSPPRGSGSADERTTENHAGFILILCC